MPSWPANNSSWLMQSCLYFFQSKVRFFKFCFQQKVVLQQKYWQSYVTDSNLVATCFILGFLYYITITIDKVSVKSLLQSLCFFSWLEWRKRLNHNFVPFLKFQTLSLWLQPITGVTDICFVFFPYEEFDGPTIFIHKPNAFL